MVLKCVITRTHTFTEMAVWKNISVHTHLPAEARAAGVLCVGVKALLNPAVCEGNGGKNNNREKNPKMSEVVLVWLFITDRAPTV